MKTLKTIWLCAVLLTASIMGAQAVNVTKLDTTTMNGGILDWSAAPAAADIGQFGATPSAGTLAAMTLGGNMTLGGLQLDSTMAGPLTIASGATLTIGTASANSLKVTNNATLNCGLTLAAGSHTWNVASGNTLTLGGAVNLSSSGNVVTMTGGGNLNIPALNTGNGTGGTLITTVGGTVSGPSITIQRTAATTTTVPTAASPVSAPASAGFYVNGAGTTVNLGQLLISTGNAAGSGRIDAGDVTVTNAVIIGRSTSGTRGAYFQVAGGTFTSLDAVNGVALSPNNGATINLSEFYVSGGTATVGKIVFGASSDTVGGTGFFLVKGGTCYMGSGGFVKSNTIAAYNATVSLFSGTLGATADWSTTMPIALSGSSGTPFTIQAADVSSVAHNITLEGAVSSSGALTKTGGGTLTMNGTNTYVGNTLISAGSLILGTNILGSVGSMASSLVTVSSNTTYDVSQATAQGFVLGSGKSVAGLGTIVGLSAGAGSHIKPAGTGAQGTLNFTGSLAASNSILDMELTSDTTGTILSNDFINVTGDLTVSATNTIVVIPVGSLSAGTYTLIHFTGTLNGDITNLFCSSGTLTNPPGSGDIQLVVTVARPTAGLVWRGDGLGNLWNTAGASNWLNGVSYDQFFTGDTNTFDDSSTNFVVNISGTVTPASTSVVMVNTTNDYTLADGGSGVISGGTGLTKTNSGNLTILTANDYTGVTTIGGGTLSILTVNNAGSPSPIGAATSGSGNLVINGGTLEYRGNNLSTDRGATLGASGATINVTNAIRTLTLSGVLTGPGVLTKIGEGQITLTGANDYMGGTVVNAGTIRANPASTLGTNTLTLNGGTTAATFLFAGDTQTMPNTINVVGTNNYLTTAGNDTVNRFTGTGTVILKQGVNNILTLQVADMTGFNGTFSADTLAFLRFFPTSGTTINAPNAMFDLGSVTNALINRDGGSYSIGGLAGGPNTTVRGSANSGSAVTTYTIGGKNEDSTYAGVIRTGTGGTGARVNIVKVGSGTLTLSGASTYTGATTISNGVLALAFNGSSDGSISGSTNINIIAGTALDVAGRSDGTMPLGGNQQLRGTGTIRGTLDTTGGGTVSPGGGTAGGLGTLTVTNTINLGGTAWMKINRASSPNSDRLVSSTASLINYGGTLVVTNTGAALQAGDTFTLFSATTLNNSFTLALPNYYNWDTSQLNVNGQVSVTAVLPPPAITNVDFSGLAGGSITLNAVNGAPNGPVTVLSSTNLALPLASWTTVTSTTFDGSGNLNLPITVNPDLPQSFYLLKVF